MYLKGEILHLYISIFAVLIALLGFVPAMADTSSESNDAQSIEEIDEIVEDNSEYNDVLSVVDELDWCPQDGSIPASARKAEICKMINEIGGLENELTANTEALKENYQNMKDKENSLENRILGAAGMATVGIGGMMAASALAEQSADAAAEADMERYLQTFQCKIGDKRFNGGETGVGIGTGNELIELYQQYVDLAADLKERKAALGMAAGIESEVIMDKAKAGLYDDVGHGIENGTYASLYRAATGSEKDASKINEQKESTASKLKTGAIVAAAGAVATAAANYMINHDNKDKSAELLAQREKITARFNEIANQMVDECNELIKEHKEFVKTLSAEQLQQEYLATYKQAVDEAQPITDISEIKDSKFCR